MLFGGNYDGEWLRDSAVILPAVLHSNFFADIGRKDLDKILASAKVKRFKAKHAIVTRGEHAQYLFVLLRGRIRYYKITLHDDEVVSRWLIPGDAFGLGIAAISSDTLHGNRRSSS
jgi:CRP-like cAMP-binding protein